MKIVLTKRFGKLPNGVGKYWLINQSGGVEGGYRTYTNALKARRKMKCRRFKV